MKNFFILLALIFSIFFLMIWPFSSNANNEQDSNASIVVTNFALLDITKHLVGKNINVSMIIPFGVDMHHFEPTAKNYINIQKSDLFLYNGTMIEPWLKSLPKSRQSLDMSNYINFQEFTHHDEEEHENKDENNRVEEDHNHKNLGVDPHYWLDIDNMIILTKRIQEELLVLFPQHQNIIINNTKKYISDLRSLQQQYEKTLTSCHQDTIIMNHNAFGYLAKRYHFKVASINNLSPESQPSAKVLTELTKLIEKNNIKTIFFESFTSDKLIRTIAKETHIQTRSVHTLANITPQQYTEKKSYIELMQENLKQLQNALECSKTHAI